jgi:hypothetical protein
LLLPTSPDETVVNFYHTTGRNTPENNLHTRRRENLKPRPMKVVLYLTVLILKQKKKRGLFYY